MSGFKTLLKKELLEQIKTYKLYIIGGVFLFFGFSTPLMLKYLPEILELADEDIIVDLPAPTAIQALGEYSATIVQVGILIVVLLAMGAIAQERSRGTAIMTLSKPVSRSSFVAAKLTALSVSFIIALVAGSVACYLYTVMLIEDISITGFLGQNLLLILFFVFSISLTLYFSSLFKNSLAAGGIALTVLIGQAVVTQLPLVGDFVPGQLTSWGTHLLSGDAQSAWGAVASTVVLILVCLYFTVRNLERRE
ncbi:MAG: ABC transporter permease subunit, partial [Chloroflexi bacterium]|nr:ABC transporter permease subunit [Chloroflexota bacterium]